MTDDSSFWSPKHPPPPPRQPTPGEPLFAFVRASDRAPMSCELRFHGESYGWEVQFFERGEFMCGRRRLHHEGGGDPVGGGGTVRV
jgi:hypothetical protein